MAVKRGFVAVDMETALCHTADAGTPSSAVTVALGNGRQIQLRSRLDPPLLTKLILLLERVIGGAGAATRIYLAPGTTDIRKGLNGLFGLVREQLPRDPLGMSRALESGHVFLFANAHRTRVKALYFDESGVWVCAKKLEKGRFRWPEPDDAQTRIVLSHEECGMLLGGIDIARKRCQRWQPSGRDVAAAEMQISA